MEREIYGNKQSEESVYSHWAKKSNYEPLILKYKVISIDTFFQKMFK